MSETLTRHIRIRVQPEYLPAQSMPQVQRWLFAYQVSIENLGSYAVQLLNRHWVITNGEGEVDEVRGPGVVGQQPLLQPGESFSYTSGCPLDTPVGTMHGEYEMLIPASGERFDALIAPFRLAVPGALN
jgi:ApaG protein